MIFYFSGTGNSQFVAARLGQRIDHEVVSINQSIKTGKTAAFHSEGPLVFVTPTYSWRIPKLVEQWIQRADFKGCQEAYFILTCGSSCGNAGRYAQMLCAEKHLKFRGLAQVLMPENYVAMFKIPSVTECRTIIENAKPHIAALAEKIQSGEDFEKRAASLGGKLQSGPVNPLFYTFCVHDKGFRVSDQCNSCGKCAQRCPLNNINLTNGKPRWQGNCTHCMACIAGCPTEAIEFKSKSKGQHRHYIMAESAANESRKQNR